MPGNLCLSWKVWPMLYCLTRQEGREGDKAKCKGVAGGCCLPCIIFPFPPGIFLPGRYKQQVSGCERGQVTMAAGHRAGLWDMPSTSQPNPGSLSSGKTPDHSLPSAGVSCGMDTWVGRGQLRDEHVQCSQEPLLQPRGCSTELRLTQGSALSRIIPNGPQRDADGEQPLLPGWSAGQGRALAQGDHACTRPWTPL